MAYSQKHSGGVGLVQSSGMSPRDLKFIASSISPPFRHRKRASHREKWQFVGQVGRWLGVFAIST